MKWKKASDSYYFSGLNTWVDDGVSTNTREVATLLGKTR
jgi:hypothetical protein